MGLADDTSEIETRLDEAPMPTMNAIRIHANGGPEVMTWEAIARPDARKAEVLVRHTAIGINFSDINVRRGGFYKSIRSGLTEEFPLILGNEAAGVVEAVGEGVSGFQPGDRVAYAGIHGQFFEDTGAYCEFRSVPEDRLVPIRTKSRTSRRQPCYSRAARRR